MVWLREAEPLVWYNVKAVEPLKQHNREGLKPMGQNDKIQLFEDKSIRTAWDENREEWYLSIVDVVTGLTD